MADAFDKELVERLLLNIEKNRNKPDLHSFVLKRIGKGIESVLFVECTERGLFRLNDGTPLGYYTLGWARDKILAGKYNHYES